MATFALHEFVQVVCLVFLLCTLRQARAETFPLATAVPHAIPEPLRPNLQQLAQQHADRLYDHLLLRTDEVDRVCQLSDARFEQLELAAKGAVQQAIDDWLASIAVEYANDSLSAASQLLTMQIRGHQLQMSVVVFDDADVRREMLKRNLIVADDGRVVEFQRGAPQIRGQVVIMQDEPEEKLREDRMVRRRPASPPSLNLDLEQVAGASIWQATLDRLLTESQRSDLNTLRIKRSLIRGNDGTQIGQMVSYLDQQLLLDSRQCERITQLCTSFMLIRNDRVDPPIAARRLMETVPEDELDELLSDRQQARWQQLNRQNRGPFDAYRPPILPEPGPELRKGDSR